MPTAVLDERGRILLPKELVEELGASKGDTVVLERRGKRFVILKAQTTRDRLEEVMDWNPQRTRRIEAATPKSVKGIWGT